MALSFRKGEWTLVPRGETAGASPYPMGLPTSRALARWGLSPPLTLSRALWFSQFLEHPAHFHLWLPSTPHIGSPSLSSPLDPLPSPSMPEQLWPVVPHCPSSDPRVLCLIICHRSLCRSFVFALHGVPPRPALNRGCCVWHSLPLVLRQVSPGPWKGPPQWDPCSHTGPQPPGQCAPSCSQSHT